MCYSNLGRFARCVARGCSEPAKTQHSVALRSKKGALMGSATLISRLLIASASLTFSTLATAAPTIAYTNSTGGNADLYLINPDGSGKVLLYSSPNRSNIGLIDMDPKSNRLVITEGGSKGFKLITYNDAGVRQTVTPVNPDGCFIEGIDFHPTDGSLIVGRYCQATSVLEVRRWTSAGYDSAPLFNAGDPQTNAISTVRWLGDGTGFFLQYGNVSTGFHIQRHSLNNPSAPVDVYLNPDYTKGFGTFDVARCAPSVDCSKLVASDQQNLYEIHFDDFGGSAPVLLRAGTDGHYSPNNSQMLYRVPAAKNGQQLMIDSAVLVSKVSAGAKDWRP